MHDSLGNLIRIEKEIQLKVNQSNLIIKKPKIIAVTKNFLMPKILPLINHGHVDFGENRVQDAISKWSDLKHKTSTIKLHMIGKLQTNKVKYVIPLFDYIHTLDNLKLAEKISEEQLKKKLRNIQTYILFLYFLKNKNKLEEVKKIDLLTLQESYEYIPNRK